MKKSKKKFVSVIMSKMILTSASAVIPSIPKVVLNVHNSGAGQTGHL
jgi:hypothetical protein